MTYHVSHTIKRGIIHCDYDNEKQTNICSQNHWVTWKVETFSGIQIFWTSKRNESWFEKSGSSSNRGVKLQCSTEEREKDFWFGFSGGFKKKRGFEKSGIHFNTALVIGIHYCYVSHSVCIVKAFALVIWKKRDVFSLNCTLISLSIVATGNTNSTPSWPLQQCLVHYPPIPNTTATDSVKLNVRFSISI